MQRRIDNEVQLGKTVSPSDSIGRPSSIDRTASNFTNATKKVQKIKRLIDTWSCEIHYWNARSRFSGYDSKYWHKRAGCAYIQQGYGKSWISNYAYK